MSLDPKLARFPIPFTFENIGDEIDGQLLGIQVEKTFVRLHLRTPDGKVRVVNVTQARLKERLLGDHDPQIGDRIRIRRLEDAPKAPQGLSPIKEFKVAVTRPGQVPGPGDGTDHGNRGSASENVSEAGSA